MQDLNTWKDTQHHSLLPISLLGIYPKKIIIEKDICTPTFIAAQFTIARTRKQPRCLLTDEWIKKLWYMYTMEYYSAIKRTTSESVLSSVQFSSVTQSCLTLCNPMNCSMPGLPLHHQLPEFTQTHIHRVSDTIQPSHPRSSPSPPAPNPSQHHSLFQWVNSSHEVVKVLECQL